MPNRNITLYKTEGSMDKVYSLSIEPAGELFNVRYQNGRRGGTLKSNLRNKTPLSLDEAIKEYERVAKTKLNDGYTEGISGQVYTSSANAGRICGHRPMLPDDLPAKHPEIMLRNMMASDAWGMQQKRDGENRIVMIKDDSVTGANKNGLFTDIPQSWVDQFPDLGSATIAGEAEGDHFSAFDLLEIDGRDVRGLPFIERYTLLQDLLAENPAPNMHLVRLVTGQDNKASHLKMLDAKKREGCVFKLLDAPYEEGKNGHTIRHKLWEDMTCFVTAINEKASVGIGAICADTGLMVDLGNVSVGARTLTVGDLIDVRYLYRFEEGALEQPVFKKLRDDVDPAKVTTAQITRIKFKGRPYEIDDETLSQQALQALAVSELKDNLQSLQHFLPPMQRKVIEEFARGEEGLFYCLKVQDLANRVRHMPSTHETDGEDQVAVAQLRYFGPAGEWLITEKDKGDPRDPIPGVQHQAFGSMDMVGGYGHELGSISLPCLLESGNVELDLYFKPVGLQEYIDAQNQADQGFAPQPA